MPRKPRFFLPDIPVHVVQRGNNRQHVFFDESDYGAYLNWLKQAMDRYNCELHAYVLMTNHVHLLMSPHETKSISQALQYLGRRYVPYINHQYGRTGTLWEGRFKASLVQEEHYVMACYRYIELNPVRAGMTTLPEQYRWSSYKMNAFGENDGLITPQAQYQALAPTPTERANAYQQLFKTPLENQVVSDLRQYLQTGTPLGNDRFRQQIEATLEVSVGQAKRGRPAKVERELQH